MSSLVSAWRVATCRSDFKSDSGAEMRGEEKILEESRDLTRRRARAGCAPT